MQDSVKLQQQAQWRQIGGPSYRSLIYSMCRRGRNNIPKISTASSAFPSGAMSFLW